MPYDRIRVLINLSGPRREFRDQLVQAFLAEAPGTGKKKETTRYTYEADLSPSGHHIELWRPALLNKGLDFTVRIPSLKLNTARAQWRHVPRHRDLIRIFTSLKENEPNQYPKILACLHQAFACEPINGLKEISVLFASGETNSCDKIPADVAVLVAKWLFAEQDLTYWNQSGRYMLKASFVDKGLWG